MYHIYNLGSATPGQPGLTCIIKSDIGLAGGSGAYQQGLCPEVWVRAPDEVAATVLNEQAGHLKVVVGEVMKKQLQKRGRERDRELGREREREREGGREGEREGNWKVNNSQRSLACE